LLHEFRLKAMINTAHVQPLSYLVCQAYIVEWAK